MSIADGFALLAQTKAKQQAQISVPDIVPWSRYTDYMPWLNTDVPNNTTIADFENERYSKNRTPCSFEDLFGFSRAGKAWLIRQAGLVEYEADVARFDKGLILENDATNYLFHSSDLTNPLTWDTNNASVAPKDGKFLLTASDAGGYLNNTRGFRVSAISFNSLYVYSNTVDKVFINFRGGRETGSFIEADLDLSTKIFTNVVSNYRQYINTDFDNNRVTGSTSASGNSSANNFTLYPKGFANAVAGDSVIVAYPQFELGKVSSYIPTSETPVTRPADFLTYNPTHGFIGAVLTGDWDATLTLSIEGGILTHEGYGTIRSLQITVPKITADFENDVYVKNGTPVTFAEAFGFSRAGKAWLFGDTGLVEYAPDMARFGNGLVLEHESTNLIRNSDLATYSLQNASFLNGKLIENNALRGHSIYTRAPNTDSVPHYLTVLARANERNILLIGNYVDNGSSSVFTCDLLTGNPIYQRSSSTSYSSKIANDWVAINVLKGWSTPYNQMHFYMVTDRTATKPTSSAYQGDGSSGMELAYPSFSLNNHIPQSVIETRGTPITRPADFLTTSNVAAQTVTGDWDATLTLSIVDGKLKHEGYGTIRNLEII
jgi:hypothetical protein